MYEISKLHHGEGIRTWFSHLLDCIRNLTRSISNTSPTRAEMPYECPPREIIYIYHPQGGLLPVEQDLQLWKLTITIHTFFFLFSMEIPSQVLHIMYILYFRPSADTNLKPRYCFWLGSLSLNFLNFWNPWIWYILCNGSFVILKTLSW